MTDLTMTAITGAVALGHTGDTAGARETLRGLWLRHHDPPRHRAVISPW